MNRRWATLQLRCSFKQTRQGRLQFRLFPGMSRAHVKIVLLVRIVSNVVHFPLVYGVKVHELMGLRTNAAVRTNVFIARILVVVIEPFLAPTWIAGVGELNHALSL